jgi:hypothetical protein
MQLGERSFHHALTNDRYDPCMSWMADLPPADIAAIEAETRGEIVRWAGKPNAGRAFLYSFGVYAVGVPWSALTFTIFGALLASIISAVTGDSSNRPIALGEYAIMGFTVAFAFPFVAIGVGMLASPFWVLSKARRTLHVITDRSVLTIVAGRTSEVTSIDPKRIAKTTRRERRDGSGTLTIYTGHEKDSDGDIVAQSEKFFSVPDVKAAEQAVEQLRQRAAGR